MDELGGRRPVQRSADPAFVFGISLVVSLVLWWPTCRAVMDGHVDVVAGGVRYLIALGVSWAGTWGIAALLAGYAHSANARALLPPDPPDHPLRRRDDAPAPPDVAGVDEPAA